MIEGLLRSAIGIGEDVKEFVKEKPITAGVLGVGSLGVGGLATATLLKAKSGTKRKKTRKGIIRDRKFISKQKHEIRRRRKRKPAKIYKRKGKYWSRKPLRKSSRTTKKRVGKIYKTKTGQPYKILSSGKAKFIKRR